ncbi:MAG TPA: pyridoxal-phosphate dependent enzyme [Candidatus Thermoplasmatota archaeon]|nr:pyridoxal-phosphate dependent enzyme [Candidatus Thermoplasmatota archaeon]
MRYHENVLSLIGNTPLVKLNRVNHGLRPLMLAKLEYVNPGGSVKDRIGAALIEAAEKSGHLKPGGTVIEGTSGNTGVGLALAANLKGYRTVFTMNDKQSREKQLVLKAFGARVIVCPTAVAPDDPRSYYSIAKKVHAETPNSVYPNQYDNQANPDVHYRTTGPEIWRDTDGKVTHYFVATGTGGTISGTAKFLKEKDPKVKVIAIDPEGSILKLYHETGEYHPELAKSYKVEGFGEDIIPRATWFQYIDEFVKVDDRESFLMARRLAREEGIFGGGSAGSAVAGMLKYVKDKQLGPDAVCVVIIPDSGSRYVNKFYSDEWMEENGYLEAAESVGRLLEAKPQPGALLSVTRADTLRRALDLMAHHGVSQLPVLDEEGAPIGSLEEGYATARVMGQPEVMGAPVSEVMQPAFPVVESTAPVQSAVALLKDSPAILVRRGGKIGGILSRYDLLAHLAKR